jgi:uncharacterized protein (TIGR03437 family)
MLRFTHPYHRGFIRALFAMFVVSLPAAVSCFAQTASMSLAAATGSAGGTVSLPISLTSTGTQPAALQWTVTYAPSDIVSVNVAAGAAATAAGKTIQCNIAPGSTLCILSGLNTTTIANGVVATLSIKLAVSPSSTSIPVSLTGVVGASAAGLAISSTGSGAAITLPAQPISIPPPSVPVPPPSIGLQSLSCTPTSLAAPAVISCTVTLSQAAQYLGAVVVVSTSGGPLLFPANVGIGAGSTAATFLAAATTAVTANTDVQITGSLNGTSASTTVKLTPSVTTGISSVTCAPTSLAPNSTATCTVGLAAAAGTTATISLTTDNAAVTVPGSVVVAPGTTTGMFTATAGGFTTDGTARIAASLNAASTVASISLVAPALLSSVACTPTSLSNGAIATCTATLSKTATANLDIALSSGGASIQVPATVRVSAGASTAQFSATAAASGSGMVTVTASAGGITKITQIMVATSVLSITRIDCPTSPLVGGTSTTCAVMLSGVAPAGGATIALTSNMASVVVPSSITVAAASASNTFAATASLMAAPGAATITATLGTSNTSATLAVERLKLVSLSCSPNPLVAGAVLICGVDLNAAPSSAVNLSNNSSANGVIHVPPVTSIAAGTSNGRFIAYSQANATAQTVRITSVFGGVAVINDISVTATKRAIASPTTQSSIKSLDVGTADEGNDARPTITSLVNAASSVTGACSPGSIATIIGSGLASQNVIVSVNGESVPVLVGASSQVTFQCPDLQAGTPLEIVVRKDGQVSNAVHVDMDEVGPAIFTINGVDRALGAIVLSDTSELAIKAPEIQGRSSKPGATIAILCTGLGREFDGQLAATPIVTIDGISATVLSIARTELGLQEVSVRIPEGVASGDLVPVEVRMPSVSGRLVTGNRVYISIDRSVRSE